MNVPSAVNTEFNIWINVAIIAGIIVFIVMMWLGLNYVFDKWFLPLSERIGIGLGKRIKALWLVTLIEATSLLLPFVYILALITTYFSTGYGRSHFVIYFIISTIVFLCWTFIATSTYIEFKKLNPQYKSSFILWLKKLFKMLKLDQLKKFYIINRFILLMEQMSDFLKAITILYLSLILLVSLKWSDNYYFLMLCFVPLYGNYWVYYVKVATVNSKKDEVFIRRVVMYTIMMAFAVYELFSTFRAFVSATENSDVYAFLLAGSAVLYVALDRILKEVTVDYLGFKNEQNKISKNKE